MFWMARKAGFWINLAEVTGAAGGVCTAAEETGTGVAADAGVVVGSVYVEMTPRATLGAADTGSSRTDCAGRTAGGGADAGAE